MERHLQVYDKSGALFAEFYFNYETATSGEVRITTYTQGETIAGIDIKPVIPLTTYTVPFSHGKINSIDEIKKFDQSPAIDQLLEAAGMSIRNMDFVYPSTVRAFRYNILHQADCVGIVNIRANFIENIKELEFMSASRIKSDEALSSNSLETNQALLRRMSALHGSKDFSFKAVY